VVRGASHIACRLLAAVWARGITLVLLGGRMGEIAAMQHGPTHADARIRLLQYRLAADPAGRTARARRLVLGKVSAQRLLLRRALASRPEARGPLLDAIATVEGIRRRLQQGAGGDLETLMGLEGNLINHIVRRCPGLSGAPVVAEVVSGKSPLPKCRAHSQAYAAVVADGVGFEPTGPLRARRFSRPVPSTARPPILRRRCIGDGRFSASGASLAIRRFSHRPPAAPARRHRRRLERCAHR
jgi:hypothetical protein